MINDHQATERVLATIQRLGVEIPVFIRTQFMRGSKELTEGGKNEVVASEVEGGLEVLSRVLRRLEIPRNLIMREVDRARRKTMNSDRRFTSEPLPLHAHKELMQLKVEVLVVVPESPALGKTTREMDLADKTGVLAVAIGRGEKLLVHRLAEIPFEVQDIIYCIGRESDLMEAASLLSAS